ncbi:MAG: polysaccharide deacetylase family protein [Planctomycetota bacterium]
MSAIAAMYHYVRPARPTPPAGIRPLSLDAFEQQLDWLQTHYRPLAPDAFATEVRDGWNEPLPPALLTFDDGTRDHLDVAAPVLERRGLRGVFFVLAGPSRDGAMPLTHALHWALGDEDRLWDALVSTVGETALGDPAEARRIYHYEPDRRARIKYAVNFALDEDRARAVVAACLDSAGVNECDLAEEWFLSEADVKTLRDRGHVVGVHGVSHRGLPVLGAEAMSREIADCADWLTDLLDDRPTWFACPFGGSCASGADRQGLRQAVDAIGLRISVSTEKQTVHSRRTDLHDLPRYDAIDLPPIGEALSLRSAA